MSSCISHYQEPTYNGEVQYVKLNPDKIISEGKTIYHWTNNFAQDTHMYQGNHALTLFLNEIGIKAEATLWGTLPDYTISDLMSALPESFSIDNTKFYFTLETSPKGLVLTYSNDKKEVLFLVEGGQLIDALAEMLMQVGKYNNNHFYPAEIESVSPAELRLTN